MLTLQEMQLLSQMKNGVPLPSPETNMMEFMRGLGQAPQLGGITPPNNYGFNPVKPNFQLVGSPYSPPGTSLVPYSPPLAEPAVPPVQASGNPFGEPRAAFGKKVGATAESRAAAAVKTAREAMTAGTPEAAAAETAATRGLLARGLGATRALGSIALPITAALGPMYFDNANPEEFLSGTSGSPESWATSLGDKPDDLGITSLAKSWGRGAFNAVKVPADWIIDKIDYLTTPKSERDKQAVRAAKPAEAPASPAELLQASPQAELPEYVIPGLGDNQQTGALDQLLQTMQGMKPERAEMPEGLTSKIFLANLWNSMSNPKNGLAPDNSPLTTLMSAYANSSLQSAMQGLAADQEYAKNTKDWLKDYAKTAVDVEKAKNDAAKGNMKIHSTKGGFLLEMNEGKNKVLKPISFNGFGNNKASKFQVGGAKFTDDNVLTPELTVLQNLSDIGQVDGVLREFDKQFAQDPDVKAVIGTPREREVKVLKLAVAMKKNPQLAQQMKTRYINTIGQAPRNAPTTEPVDLWNSAPPAEGAADFLTTLTGGQ